MRQSDEAGRLWYRLFSDEKGNYEPQRDFVESGNGENGAEHHTKPEQQPEVDRAIQEYGTSKKILYH